MTENNNNDKKNKNEEINNNTFESESLENAENEDSNVIDEQQQEKEVETGNLDLLKNEIEEMKKQNEQLKDTLLRKVAEFENFKRRTENDQFNLIKYAAESFILNILPVYDDMGRSLDHIEEGNNIDSLKKGLLLVYDKFTKVLEEHGVKRIESKGEKFDFNLHEALMLRPAEGVEPHTVLEEIEPGYMYKDKVIRHAKVVVSQEMASDGGAVSDENSAN